MVGYSVSLGISLLLILHMGYCILNAMRYAILNAIRQRIMLNSLTVLLILGPKREKPLRLQ